MFVKFFILFGLIGLSTSLKLLRNNVPVRFSSIRKNVSVPVGSTQLEARYSPLFASKSVADSDLKKYPSVIRFVAKLWRVTIGALIVKILMFLRAPFIKPKQQSQTETPALATDKTESSTAVSDNFIKPSPLSPANKLSPDEIALGRKIVEQKLKEIDQLQSAASAAKATPAAEKTTTSTDIKTVESGLTSVVPSVTADSGKDKDKGIKVADVLPIDERPTTAAGKISEIYKNVMALAPRRDKDKDISVETATQISSGGVDTKKPFWGIGNRKPPAATDKAVVVKSVPVTEIVETFTSSFGVVKPLVVKAAPTPATVSAAAAAVGETSTAAAAALASVPALKVEPNIEEVVGPSDKWSTSYNSDELIKELASDFEKVVSAFSGKQSGD